MASASRPSSGRPIAGPDDHVSIDAGALQEAASQLGLHADIADEQTLSRVVNTLRNREIVLPLFSELAEPHRFPTAAAGAFLGGCPNANSPANLHRLHWFNKASSGNVGAVPTYLELTPEITGVQARIIVLLGDTFPLIGSHKVLAAYACLIPRLATGRFDPSQHRAIWPSTGNYARGGVAISRLLGCRGVAVLPENMSRERFAWLEQWVSHPDDIVRTAGSESNVREIFAMCDELASDPANIVFNQFSEYANHLVHYSVTGRALETLVQHLVVKRGLTPAAFVAATGSAGTLAAGERLKTTEGTKLVAVEPLQCATMLYNGFGEHRIQGIGDKHIPLIHNVMNTDGVIAVSDESVERVDLLFNSCVGRSTLNSAGIDASLVVGLRRIGLSGICNVLASIKFAKYTDLDDTQMVLTVATDGSELYKSERPRVLRTRFHDRLDGAAARCVLNTELYGADTSHVRILDDVERHRIFNLGYFTWVEQRGLATDLFELRRHQRFWQDIRSFIPRWDELIAEMNSRGGVQPPGQRIDTSPR